jgi:hypothetical protein
MVCTVELAALALGRNGSMNLIRQHAERSCEFTFSIDTSPSSLPGTSGLGWALLRQG